MMITDQFEPNNADIENINAVKKHMRIKLNDVNYCNNCEETQIDNDVGDDVSSLGS